MSNADKIQNFSEIFDMIAEPGIGFSAETPMEWSSDIDPMHLAYLMGTVEIDISTSKKPFNNPYLKYKKTIVRPDHSMNSPQQNAFDLINSYLIPQQQLKMNMNATELKRGYKKAALRAHPDCGGTHESFLKLKSSFELLLAFLAPIK